MMILVIPVMAVKPTYDEVVYYQTQFQWRGCNENSYPWFGRAFGAWSNTPVPGLSSSHMRLTGNVLHSYFEYSPVVSNPVGMPHVFVYDGASHWILHEGETGYSYPPYYGPYALVNYFRGYVEFSDTPSPATFVKGVLYQWVYVMEPQTEPVQSAMEHAVWDPVMNAWLVGFSVYLQYPTSSPPIPVAFTWTISSLPRPVPANIYNPLNL